MVAPSFFRFFFFLFFLSFFFLFIPANKKRDVVQCTDVVMQHLFPPSKVAPLGCGKSAGVQSYLLLPLCRMYSPICGLAGCIPRANLQLLHMACFERIFLFPFACIVETVELKEGEDRRCWLIFVYHAQNNSHHTLAHDDYWGPHPKGREVGEIEGNFYEDYLARFDTLATKASRPWWVLQALEQSDVFVAAIPRDLLTLLRLLAHHCHAFVLFLLRFGYTFKGRVCSKVLHHPFVKVFHVGDGVHDSAGPQDVGIFSALHVRACQSIYGLPVWPARG